MRPHALLHFTDSGSTDIYAFIPDTLSWLHVGDLPEPMRSAIVLPSDELLVVDGKTGIVYKATPLQGKLMLMTFIYCASSVNMSGTCAHCVVHQSSSNSAA